MQWNTLLAALRFLIATVSISLVISACGSGGGGAGSGGANPPPPPVPVEISRSNALQVAAIGMVLPGATLQLVDLAADSVRSVIGRSEKQFTKACDGGGFADYDFTDANLDGVPGDGDSIRVTYRSCLISQFQQTGSGSVTLTFAEPAQPWTSEDSFFEGRIDATQLTTEVRTVFEFGLHFGLLEESYRASGDVLFVLNIDGVDYSERLVGFSVSKRADFETARNEIAYSGTVTSELLDGSITYDEDKRLSGFLNTFPEQGRFEAKGANGSRVAVIPYNVPNSTLAEVHFDETGGGTFIPLDDRQFWTSFTPDFTWSYTPTRQQFIRPYDPNDFWYVGAVPIQGDEVPVQSSIRLQFARQIDSSTVPATVSMIRDVDAPPFSEIYEASTDYRGAAIILRPLHQLRHGSDYDYPANTITVDDLSGNTASACCESFATRANLLASAKASHVFGVAQANIDLIGSQSTSTDAAIASYSWTQLGGTPAVISNADQSDASLEVAAVAAPEALRFQLNISDTNGEIEWDEISVHAFPDAASVSLLYFYGDEQDDVSLGKEWLLSSANNTTTVRRDAYNGIWFQSGSWNLLFVAPGDTDIEVGSYENAVRYQTVGSNSPELSIFGDGRSCNTSIGRFDVLEVEYDSNGEVLVAAINFEQFCDRQNAKLTGYLRIGSDIRVPARP